MIEWAWVGVAVWAATVVPYAVAYVMTDSSRLNYRTALGEQKTRIEIEKAKAEACARCRGDHQ